MNRWICSRTNPFSCSHRWLDGTACVLVFCSTAVSPFLAGSWPGGLVTHEDTPPVSYFHSFWLYLTQEEVDYYWEKLSEGGDAQAQQCGWLKDKYSMSWQVVPTVLTEMLKDADAETSKRVMKALLHMKKMDVETLKRAYQG
jgi:hypothetical protein